MKTNKALLSSVVVGMIVLLNYACNKNGVRPSTTSLNDSTAVFSATVSGVDWQADSVSAFLVHEDHDGDRYITINGFSANKLITVLIKDTSSVIDSAMALGTYTVRQWGNTAAFGYASDKIPWGRDSVWQTQGVAKSGEAIVTASDGVNKIINGTFDFTARVVTIDSTGIRTDTLPVTNGVFNNIHYLYVSHR